MCHTAICCCYYGLFRAHSFYFFYCNSTQGHYCTMNAGADAVLTLFPSLFQRPLFTGSVQVRRLRPCWPPPTGLRVWSLSPPSPGSSLYRASTRPTCSLSTSPSPNATTGTPPSRWGCWTAKRRSWAAGRTRRPRTWRCHIVTISTCPTVCQRRDTLVWWPKSFCRRRRVSLGLSCT